MEDLLLRADELPPRLLAWLGTDRPAQVVSLELLLDGTMIVRPLLEVEPALIAQVGVAIAKYHDALTNLT
jgi:hypothetical protein